MIETPTNHPRVLAIDPTTKGFAYALLEGPSWLIDWGLTQVEGRKNSNCILRLEKLIDRYAPEVLVLEDYRGTGSRRCARVTRLIGDASIVAHRNHLRTKRFSRGKLQRFFSDTGHATKRAIAVAIAERFPELAPRLPRIRKPWMSEDERMSIFDAVALAVTYFEEQSKRSKPLAEAA
jgi:Holliday junction resolvasome RuvABC endonuclease subunit